MNNQEQEVRTPETDYGERRPINTDPREQPQQPVGPYMAMGRPPQRRSPWYWMVVGMVIVGVILGGLAVASFAFSKTVTETKTFAVGNQPTLVLTDGNGSVHVVSGPAGQITIVAHRHLPSYQNDAIQIQYQQSSDGNTVTVHADENSGVSLNLIGLNVWSNFDVTVPSHTNLNMKTGNGSVDAQNISGQIALSSGNGSVTADNSSGQMTMHSGNGSITITNGQASGSSTFEDGNGSITFDGSVAPNGSYLFTTGNGSIDLTLPANAAFHVQATTGNGSTDTDFSGLLNNNGTLVGEVGSAPFAQLTMHTGNGSIHLHKGA